MERSLVSQHLTASLSNPDHLAQWSQVLMRHHRDIQGEIDTIGVALANPGCRLLPIDARLRRLSRAVLMHLQLEDCFLAPALARSGGAGRLQMLTAGYQDLQRTLVSTVDFLQREKLCCTRPVLSDQQKSKIRYLMQSIRDRLDIEDDHYQLFGEGDQG